MITKEKLEEYQVAYSQGNPLITDEEYDVLLEEYLNIVGEENRPFLRKQQTSAISEIVGTLPKVYGVKTPMRDGQKVYADWVVTKKIDKDTKIVLQPKFDGCSIACDLQTNTWSTRGDYDNGISVDVTELFGNRYDGYIKQYAEMGFESIKFEAILSVDMFKSNTYIHEKYAKGGPRGFVSGTIASRNIELCNYITLVPLRLYKGGNMYIPKELISGNKDAIITNIKAGDFDTIQFFIDLLLNRQACTTRDECYSFECDGVVVSTINDDGSIGNEVAIKILHNVKETKLLGIDFQFGKQGRITPVAILEPVEFNGKIIKNVTLSTLERVMTMGLKHGDTVKIMYNIVPYLISSMNDGSYPIQLPTKCPYCGTPFDLSTLKIVRCPNPNCEGVRLGSIIRYCEKMKMFGISKKTIELLFDNGLVKSIGDLYRLTENDILSLPGFKQKSCDNLLNTIDATRKDVDLARWLGALPLQDSSSNTWEAIIKLIYKNDMFMATNGIRAMLDNDIPDEFITLLNTHCYMWPGKIVKICQGLRFNWKTIQDIAQYVSFNCLTKMDDVVYDKKATLTGTHDKNVIAYLNERGYKVVSFNKSINLLVIPNNDFVSSKVTKAKSLGIPIITVEELYNNDRI